MTEKLERFVEIAHKLVDLARDMRDDGCSPEMIDRMFTRELRGLPRELAEQVADYLDGPG